MHFYLNVFRDSVRACMLCVRACVRVRVRACVRACMRACLMSEALATFSHTSTTPLHTPFVGLPTSTSRQKACTLEPINAFLSCLEDALEEHPILRLAIQNVITYDESPLNQHADKHKPYEAIYLKDIRKKSGGAARVAAPLAGSKRMTLCESIAADGHVFKPGFFVAGQAPQAAWTAAPYPMHITEDAAKSTVIICTDAGVANTESHLQMLELQCIKPAHERRYKADLNIPLLLIIDNANCHGFDIDFEDMSKEMAELFAKYNVVCVPLPANTSTHLSPLDLRYFGFLKTCLDTTLNDIVQVASNPEWGLNPTILKVEQVAVLFPGRCNADSQDYPTALERAANLEGSLGPRTMILGILLIHASKRRDLEDVAYGSWSSTGVWPPSRGVFLQKCGAGEVKMAMKTEREKEANERRSQRREMGELGKDVLKRVICLAQAGLGSGTLDGMKVVGDEIVAAIRKDLKTAGAYLDFIDSLPNKAGKVERTKRQTKYKGTIYYNMYQVEQAAKDDVRAKEKAKQLEKEDKDKEREKKKESARVLKEAAEAIAATERQEKKAKKDEERQLKKAADDKAKAERKLKREEEKNKERQLKKAAVAKEKDEQKLKREEAKEERRLMREGGRTQEAKGCTFRDGKKRAASAMDGAEQPPQQPPAKRIAPAVKKTNRGRSTKVPERFKSS